MIRRSLAKSSLAAPAFGSDRESEQGLHPRGVVYRSFRGEPPSLGRSNDQVEILSRLIDLRLSSERGIHDQVVAGRFEAMRVNLLRRESRQEMPVGRLLVDI